MGVSIGSGVAFGIGPPGSTGAGITPPPTPYSIQYLVVAGGGAGGYGTSGGGGAGGLLQGSTILTAGTAYTIQIGAGGVNPGSPAPGARGGDGFSSNISGSGFTAITTTGGGGGGGAAGPLLAGDPGGSGGGASSSSGSFGTATGSPGSVGVAGPQGYPGGPGNPANGGGGSGGSGVVIIAVPTPNYPGAYGPQATTPPSAPGMTVITFTAPGTYTA